MGKKTKARLRLWRWRIRMVVRRIMAPFAGQPEHIGRSTWESYIGIAVAICSVVFHMSWIFITILLCVLLLIIADVCYRNAWLRKLGKPLTIFGTLLIVAAFAFIFIQRVREQYNTDQEVRAAEEYSPSVLREDSLVTLDLKAQQLSLVMRQWQSDLDAQYFANGVAAAKKERQASTSSERSKVENRRETTDEELYADFGRKFRKYQLQRAWALESEMMTRLLQTYLGRRGRIVPPSHFPQRPSALIHGDLSGANPLGDIATYFDELIKLQ